MSRASVVGGVLVAIVAAAAAWILFVGLPRWYEPRAQAPGAQPSALPAEAMRKIKASLFYVSEDGLRLAPFEREVSFGEGTVEQARRLVEAQLETPAPPLTSAVPAGTRLRALYVSNNGDAYVDLSREAQSGHPGGALNEILTVYTIVLALTSNLPAIGGVQILVDGHEVDTLAGHVDLRRPLPKSTRWVEAAKGGPAAPTGEAPRAPQGP